MLKNELHKLEQSVLNILEEKNITDQQSYFNRITEQVKYVQSYCSELRKKWAQELLSSAKEQVVKRYVQFHQAGIIQLSNQIVRKIPAKQSTPSSTGPFAGLLFQITDELERVLDFLRHKFYQYFDKDHRVSIHNCRVQCQKIELFKAELGKYYETQIDAGLIRAYIASVQDMLDEAQISGVTYRQIEHTLNLLRMTEQMIYILNGTTTETLTKALYKQNLNTLHFTNWYKEYLEGRLYKLKNETDRNYLLQTELAELTGIFVNPEKAFEPELDGVDHALLPWIKEIRSGSKKPVKTNGQNVNGKLPLNLSVPQFALFVRIFYKTGCFPIENISRLTRFFTQHFTTKKQPHISFKSFGRAFYSLDQVSAAVVRDYLQKMLNYLNKTYFP